MVLVSGRHGELADGIGPPPSEAPGLGRVEDGPAADLERILVICAPGQGAETGMKWEAGTCVPLYDSGSSGT